jgi:predicted small lipoprotein YifL
MKASRCALLLAFALAALSLAGCGNKGDLVRPEPTAGMPAGS